VVSFLALAGTFQLAGVPPASAQEPAPVCRPYADAGTAGWDDARVLRIVREAAIERKNAYSDSTLAAFDAYAE
jgi:hypothetical protein